MIEGDTLQSVAYTELGNPAYWRAIAELNGIDDPQRVTAGTTLLIPSVADAARGS
jgi:nucleoid-associated protein YgaU